MRDALGTTPQALARRGIAVDRLAVLTLPLDGASALPLWLGERTHYRAAASVLDAFDRPDGALGLGYAPLLPATAGLTLTSQQVVPLTASAGHVEGYATVLPRDQWAEVTLQALTPGTGTATVGVGVRWVGTTGYLATAFRGADGIGHAALLRYTAGTPTTLLDVGVPWQRGETLRLTAEWDRLRLYRQSTLIGELIDASPLLVAGQAALFAGQTVAGAVAALDSFLAGPLRQEYVGLLADLGDVSASLGYVEPTATPAAWSLSLINLGPVGGAARFTDLWRHGAHGGTGTYDLHRAPVTVVQAIAGGSGPLAVADGRVAHAEGLTEAVVRLVCAGRDAFLTPDIQAGPVTYLPGPDPISTPAPIPVDPCGADAPQPAPLDAGLIPAEPSVPADAAGVATGPEAPPPPTTAQQVRVIYGRVHRNAPHDAVWHESDTPRALDSAGIAGTFINPEDSGGALTADDHDAGQEPSYHLMLVRSPVIGVWAPTTAYAYQARIRRAIGEAAVFRVDTPGTSGAAPPPFDLDVGDTTVDGTVTWVMEAVQDPIVEALPGTHLRLVLSASMTADPYYHVSTKDARAPVNMDEVLEWTNTTGGGIGGTGALHTGTSGHAPLELTLEVGVAEVIVIVAESSYGPGEGCTVTLFEAQFFTPEPL